VPVLRRERGEGSSHPAGARDLSGLSGFWPDTRPQAFSRLPQVQWAGLHKRTVSHKSIGSAAGLLSGLN